MDHKGGRFHSKNRLMLFRIWRTSKHLQRPSIQHHFAVGDDNLLFDVKPDIMVWHQTSQPFVFRANLVFEWTFAPCGGLLLAFSPVFRLRLFNLRGLLFCLRFFCLRLYCLAQTDLNAHCPQQTDERQINETNRRRPHLPFP